MTTFEFKLPDIGEGVVEGEIVKWLVQQGEQVAEDQPLVEVMTDKATVTIPSPKKGKVIRIWGKEGEVTLVHAPLVTLELEAGGEAAAAVAPAERPPGPDAQAPTAAAAPAAIAATSGGAKVLATPVTRRMAREHGLNLASISGSGPQGRVTKVDVLAALSGPSAKAPQNIVSIATTALDRRIPLRGLRKKIAEKMVRSKHTAAHFTFVEEMDATALVELRKRLNERLAEAGETSRISFLPLIVKALVATLRRFPSLNANMDEATQELVVRGDFNIGIAAATEEGLTVPVVRQADRLSLRALGEEISRLGAAARERRLRMEELTSGTFTITSLGQKGGLFATPVINHPEVAILGVHKMRKRPVVNEEGEIVVREMMYLSLSFDHRVIDGAVGADFTYALIRYLEHPEMLLLEMT